MNKVMWRLVFPIAIGVIAFAAIPPAAAQTASMRLDIPFDFVVGNKVLPAGQYTAKVDRAFNTLRLQCGNEATTVLLAAAIVPTAGAESNSAKLVFHQYGHVYILREVWTNGGWYGRELYWSKAERELARTPSHTTVASTVVTPR